MVLEVQDGGRGHSRVRLFSLSVEDRHDEHAWSHQARIAHLDAHLCSTYRGVEYWPNVANDSRKYPVGISIKANVRLFPEGDVREVVFIYVAKDPDVG